MMDKLKQANKATLSTIATLFVTLGNKYALEPLQLGMDTMEQGLVSAGIVALVVFFVPNKEKRYG